MQVRGTGMRFTVLGCSQLPGESTRGESRAEEAGALGDHLVIVSSGRARRGECA